MSSMWLFAGKLRPSRLFPFHDTRCRGKNARRAHTSSSVCGSGLQPIRRPRSRPCSMKRGCVQGWEAALPPAKSIGFVLPIPFPSPARRGRDSVRADNEAMDGTRPWPQPNCSMSMSRPLPIGVTRGFWRASVLIRMAHAGLASPQTSSRNCASRLNDIGSVAELARRAKTW